eukprot:3409045-Rhodomonas_salina.2
MTLCNCIQEEIVTEGGRCQAGAVVAGCELRPAGTAGLEEQGEYCMCRPRGHSMDVGWLGWHLSAVETSG